jgi:hypothetical protein
MHRGIKNAFKLVVRKPEGKSPLLSHRSWWEDNIKIEIKERGYGDVE